METASEGKDGIHFTAPFIPSRECGRCLHSEFCILNFEVLKTLPDGRKQHRVLDLHEGRSRVGRFDFVGRQRLEKLTAKLACRRRRLVHRELDGAPSSFPLRRGGGTQALL
jgi:hypothetical protein